MFVAATVDIVDEEVEVEVATVEVMRTAVIDVEVAAGEGAARSRLSPIPNLGVSTKSEGTTTPMTGDARGGRGEASTLAMRQATSRH